MSSVNGTKQAYGSKTQPAEPIRIAPAELVV